MKKVLNNINKNFINYSTKPLHWRLSFTEKGTAFFTHPTHEELMSYKQSLKNKSYLKPEDIPKIKELRESDPWTNTSKNLAKTFNVSPELINQVSKEPKIKVLQDLRRLREFHKNKPKKGSKQNLNNLKLGGTKKR
jgi:hypothetical protein